MNLYLFYQCRVDDLQVQQVPYLRGQGLSTLSNLTAKHLTPYPKKNLVVLDEFHSLGISRECSYEKFSILLLTILLLNVAVPSCPTTACSTYLCLILAYYTLKGF